MKTFENIVDKPTIPTYQTCIMFLIAFYGTLCVAWFIFMLCGYPIWSYHNIDITAFRLSRGFDVLGTLFFTYIIYSQYKKGGLQQFAGLSIPIVLLLLMLFCRQIADLWLLQDEHPIERSLIRLAFPIMLFAFVLPVDRNSYRKVFYCIYTTLFILTAITLFTWEDWIFSGYTMRSIEVRKSETKILQSIAFGINLNITYNIIIERIGTIGALLSLLSLYTMLHKKQITILSVIVFSIGYAMGCILICFTAYKGILIGFSVSALFALGMYWRTWKATGIIFVLLIIGSICFLTVGCRDIHSILKRTDKQIKNVSKDYADIISKVSEIDISKTELPKTEPSKTDSPKSEPIRSDINKHTFDTIVINPYKYEKKPLPNNWFNFPKLCNIMGTTNPRIALYTISIHEILHHPLLGYGQALLLDIDGNNPCIVTTHCNVLTIFLATGMFGGFLFLYIIIRGGFDSLVISKNIPEISWITGIFIFAFVTNLFENRVIEYAPLWVPLVAMRACVKTQIKPKLQEIKSEKIDEVKQ
jgi:hypothetical protein